MRSDVKRLAILRSIPWRSLAVGGTLSKQAICRREYIRDKLASRRYD
jgi:hypothetical protein